MRLGLDGKRAIITAAGAGIGRRTAELFHAAGARLFLCDIDEGALADVVAELPGSGGVVADVADRAAVDRLFEAAAGHLGGLDILVNNAGVAGPTAAVEDVEPDDWERTFAVGLTGMFLCTRRAVPLLKQAGRGSIVNLSSAAGRFGFALRSPYSAMKWGVVGFTKSIAIELGPHDINVNTVQPGAVEGERIDRVIAAKAKARGIPESAMRAEMTDIASMKTFVTADDIAQMILYLCSDAGHRISGQALAVDAGLEVLR